LGDGQTAQELAAEAAFAAAMRPVLDELYRWPLRNGLDAVPEGDREQVIRWLLRQYRDSAATAVLIFTLKKQFESGFNAGGNIALEALGLPGSFALQDEALLATIEETAVSYANTRAEISLTRTTAVELGRQIVSGRAAGLEGSALSAVLASYISGRTMTRSSGIATTETVRWSRRALGTTYVRNGIEWMIYRTAPAASESGPCPICTPFEGRRLRASNGSVWVDLIPQHTGCVCYYVPDTSGWERPEEVWTGG
jgi:hypothetical protein